MDIDAIRLEVFKQTGMNIEQNDPFYAALVMLSMIATDIEIKNDAALALINEAVKKLAASENQSHKDNGKLLNDSVIEIRAVVGQLTGMQDGITRAAKSNVREILLGEGGPIAKLNTLVRQQHDSLGWLNKAANVYSKELMLWRWQTTITALACSVIGGGLVKYL